MRLRHRAAALLKAVVVGYRLEHRQVRALGWFDVFSHAHGHGDLAEDMDQNTASRRALLAMCSLLVSLAL